MSPGPYVEELPSWESLESQEEESGELKERLPGTLYEYQASRERGSEAVRWLASC